MDKRLATLDLRCDSAEPKHERLKQHFVNEILAGRLKPGQVVPTELHLVKTLGVARATIRQAMASLENDGLIRRTRGRGTFVETNIRQRLKPGLDIFALIVPETREGFYPSLLHGFETAARGIRHQTLVCSTDDNVERQGDIILQLLDKKVGGVAINPTSPTPTPAYQVRQLQERGIPVVFCHQRVEGIAAPLLSLPYHDIGWLAGKSLFDRGHRHIAFFTTLPVSESTARAYEKGLAEAMQIEDGHSSMERVCVQERPIQAREESCWAALQEIFSKPDRPTAIFASFDSLAELIYMLLPRLGLRIPEDVSLIGEGGVWREGVITRRLTSVVVDEIATGQKAVDLLHEMREGERPIDDNTEIVMELSLSDGKTLAAPASICL